LLESNKGTGLALPGQFFVRERLEFCCHVLGCLISHPGCSSRKCFRRHGWNQQVSKELPTGSDITAAH
jgi:hypothetical protein